MSPASGGVVLRHRIRSLKHRSFWRLKGGTPDRSQAKRRSLQRSTPTVQPRAGVPRSRGSDGQLRQPIHCPACRLVIAESIRLRERNARPNRCRSPHRLHRLAARFLLCSRFGLQDRSFRRKSRNGAMVECVRRAAMSTCSRIPWAGRPRAGGMPSSARFRGVQPELREVCIVRNCLATLLCKHHFERNTVR